MSHEAPEKPQCVSLRTLGCISMDDDWAMEDLYRRGFTELSVDGPAVSPRGIWSRIEKAMADDQTGSQEKS